MTGCLFRWLIEAVRFRPSMLMLLIAKVLMLIVEVLTLIVKLLMLIIHALMLIVKAVLTLMVKALMLIVKVLTLMVKALMLIVKALMLIVKVLMLIVNALMLIVKVLLLIVNVLTLVVKALMLIVKAVLTLVVKALLLLGVRAEEGRCRAVVPQRGCRRRRRRRRRRQGSWSAPPFPRQHSLRHQSSSRHLIAASVTPVIPPRLRPVLDLSNANGRCCDSWMLLHSIAGNSPFFVCRCWRLVVIRVVLVLVLVLVVAVVVVVVVVVAMTVMGRRLWRWGIPNMRGQTQSEHQKAAEGEGRGAWTRH